MKLITKLISFFIIVLSSFSTKAQEYSYRGTGYGYIDNAIRIPYQLSIPNGSTPTFNGRPEYNGSLFYTGPTKSLYVYDSATATWVDITGGGSSGLAIQADTTQNLYDTLTIFNLTPSGSSLPNQFGGNATNYSISDGAINFSAGSGDFTKYITYDSATLPQNAIETIRFTYNTQTTSDDGIWVGWQSINAEGYVESIGGGLVFNSGAGFLSQPYGRLVYYAEVPNNVYGSPFAENTNIDQGDNFVLTIQKQDLNYQLTIEDSTQDWIITYPSITSPSGGGTPFTANNTSYPAIWPVGGSFSVTNWTYSLIFPKSLDLAIEGNSIAYGEDAITSTASWPNNVGRREHNIKQGGGADYAQSVYLRTNEIIKMHPTYVLNNIGGNDILFEREDLDSNLIAIRDLLATNGIKTIWIYPTPRTATDERPLVNFLDTCSDFSNDLKIRGTFYGLLENGTSYSINPLYNSGDNIHPNTLGHRVIANIINDSLYKWEIIPYSMPVHNPYEYVNSRGLYNGQSIFGGTQPGGQLYLGGSVASDSGIVNIQNQAFFTSNGIGLGTSMPQYLGITLDNSNTLTIQNNPLNLSTGYPYIHFNEIFGASFPRLLISTNPGFVDAGVLIGPNQISSQTDQILTLCSECSVVGGVAPSSYDFNIEEISENSGNVDMYTDIGNNPPGGNIIIGSEAASNYTAYFDMKNHMMSVGDLGPPSYTLDVAGNIHTYENILGVASDTPSCVTGAGAGGSGISNNIIGSQLSGTITINTTGTPTASSIIATLTYVTPFPTGSVVILTPQNVAAFNAGINLAYVSSSSTTGAVISSGSTPLATNTTYIWYYYISGW